MKISLTLLFCLLTTNLHAGIIIKSIEQKFRGSIVQLDSVLYIDFDRIRIDTQGPFSDESFIYNASNDIFWMINFKNKTYTEITPKDRAAMKNKLQEAMAIYKDQMQKMPPEQKIMMQEWLKTRMPGMSVPPKLTFKKTNSNQRVHKWIGDQYQGSLDGIKQKEIWSVPWATLGISPDDFIIMENVISKFEDINQNFSKWVKFGSRKWNNEKGYKGFPVQVIRYSINNQAKSKTQIKEIIRQNLDSSLFSLPKGLKLRL